jgi:hypothetical protein
MVLQTRIDAPIQAPAIFVQMRSVFLFALLLTPELEAQVPADLARDRAQFAEWLKTAPNSPLVARAMAPVGPGIRIGPAEAEIPFPGIDARITERGGVATIEGSAGTRVLPRNRVTTLGALTLFLSGPAGKSVVTAYGGERKNQAPEYYPYDATRIFIGPLRLSEPRRFMTLALDGIEVEATEVGSVVVPDGSSSTSLRVYRIPDVTGEESDLMIYFRDATSGKGSYPAGRFVILEPLEGGRYRLDLNRAQNPFCAYRSVYPCPAPWPGNTLRMAVEAGEQYTSTALPTAPAKAP